MGGREVERWAQSPEDAKGTANAKLNELGEVLSFMLDQDLQRKFP